MVNRRGLRPPEPETPAEVEYENITTVETTNDEVPVVEIPQTHEYLGNAVAFSVIRKGDVYQLIRVIFDQETLIPSVAEVMLENTDRWEVQGQYDVFSDEAFLMKEDL